MASIIIPLASSGRSQARVSSKMAKRRRTAEMREKVQSRGAFSSRTHERSSDISEAKHALKVSSSAVS